MPLKYSPRLHDEVEFPWKIAGPENQTFGSLNFDGSAVLKCINNLIPEP